MKAKWFFGALIVMLIAFGISQQCETMPNQQIVLQFSDKNVTDNVAESTIDSIEKQLQAIGVNTITVIKEKNGVLKIAYHSNSDTADIKQLLSTSISDVNLGRLPLNPENKPTKKEAEKFNIEVFEISKDSNSNTGLGDAIIVELKQESVRFYTPEFNVLAGTLVSKLAIFNNSSVAKIKRQHAVVLSNTVHNIPEVRAGPVC